MLRLQRARRKQRFISELLLMSALLHGIFLFYLLVVYSGYRYSTHIVVKRSSVRLLDSYFLSPSTNEQRSLSTTSPIKKQQLVKSTSQKVPSTVLKKEELKKVAAKKPQQKQTRQNKKKQIVQQQKKKQEPKKVVNKDKPQVKKILRQNIAKKEQQPLQKKQETALNKENPRIAHPERASIRASRSSKPVVSEEPILDFIDIDTLQIQQYIQHEISRVWNPPIGLPEDIACNIKITIGGDGIVSEASVEESSGILVYDVSAHSAAVSLLLPRWAWGKEFMISFKQE